MERTSCRAGVCTRRSPGFSTAHFIANNRQRHSNGLLRQEVDVFVRLSEFQCQLRQSPASPIFAGLCPQVSSSHSALHRNQNLASSRVTQLPRAFRKPCFRNRGAQHVPGLLRLMCRCYSQLVDSAGRRRDMRHGGGTPRSSEPCCGGQTSTCLPITRTASSPTNSKHKALCWIGWSNRE
jgi:hypothetical protein